MAEKDFYAEWLGVAAPARPPNHYQLLGLKDFEADKGLIQQAAARQRQKLQPFLGGSPDERETAERLLLTLKRAEYVLGDPARRREYDAWLRETREKGAPKTVLLAAVAAEQELLTHRDRAIQQANWDKAEEVALKLVSFDPQNVSHQQVLAEVQARRAQGAKKALGLKAVRGIVLAAVLVGVILLLGSLARRIGKAGETGGTAATPSGGVGGLKPGEQRTGPPPPPPAAGATRPTPAGTQPQADAAEAVTKAEKLLQERKFAEALAAYQEARTKSRAGGAAAAEGVRSLEAKIAAAKTEARDRAKAAEGQTDWAGATQAWQDLAALGETREAQPHLAAVQAAAQAEQSEKAGKLEEAVAAYKKVAAGLVDRSALDAKVADLEKQIETTRPKLKY